MKSPKVAFNPDELSTWNQAQRCATKIDASRPFLQAGITVAEVYLPSWISGPGGDPEPFGPGGLKWWHFKFSNGMSGVNVGLVITEFAIYPAAPLYVEDWLLAQVQAGLKRLRKAA